MKIRLDFVSNSSSTSFVYISNEELSEEVFLKAAGVQPDSPVVGLFRDMHAEICYSIEQPENRLTSKEAIEKYSGGYEFTPETIAKMKGAIDRGEKVIKGSLSSESTLAELALCTEVFEIESDDFYISAYNNYW